LKKLKERINENNSEFGAGNLDGGFIGATCYRGIRWVEIIFVDPEMT
jgi:hypothetical protein